MNGELFPQRLPSRRFLALGVVAALHVLAIYALANLKHETPHTYSAPLQVVALAPRNDSPDSASSLPTPTQHTPAITLPAPVIEIAAMSESNSITVASTAVSALTQASSAAPKLVSAVEYAREPVPRYPPAARALKQRGTVTLRALIDAHGQAREVDVHRSSGFRLLDDAARLAVLHALFKPYAENGRTQPVYVLIPIEFGAS